jgi:threonyl-tRNA synthetase
VFVDQEYQRVMEEAKKRDHRVLGRRLDLFSIQEVSWPATGSGFLR